MFNNRLIIDVDDRIEYGEARYSGIGFLKNIVAVVIFTERGTDTIRIISARKATKHEREKFEKQFPY